MSRPARLRPAFWICVGFLGFAGVAHAHDIPDARVDRSIQVRLSPGRLEVGYEVGLSELTLAQDLRSLLGAISPEITTREALYRMYGRETGPLNARGLLVSVDGAPLGLAFDSFDLFVEEHPRFLFHLSAPLPSTGSLSLMDTNYASSEGTSRLALATDGAVTAAGYEGPEDVEAVEVRPVWMLSNEEERRTKQVEVSFATRTATAQVEPDEPNAIGEPSRTLAAQESGAAGSASGGPSVGATPPRPGARAPASPMSDRLTRLLDGTAGAPVLGLCLAAFLLGAAHAVQPGHGKTLVAAASLGERGGMSRGALLALVTTVAHTGGVVAVAAALWLTRTTRYGSIHAGLGGVAGFLIAAIGLWRLGRHLAGHGEHGPIAVPAPPVAAKTSPLTRNDPHARAAAASALGTRGLIGLGLAGGLVPCWDAVLLILLADVLGRLALGLVLLGAFSAGMAIVLVVVGVTMARIGGLVSRRGQAGRWERRLGLLSGLVLAGIGLAMLATS